jgi:hypothetical protein
MTNPIIFTRTRTHSQHRYVAPDTKTARVCVCVYTDTLGKAPLSYLI